MSTENRPTSEAELPLAECAMQLRTSWYGAWKLLLRGDLQGRRDTRGRWLVTVASLEAEIGRRGSAPQAEASA